MVLSRRSVLISGAATAITATSLTMAAPKRAKLKEIEMSALKNIRHLDYTVLFARNMPAMRNFYENVMEFELQRELTPQWIEYRVGSCILALTERGLMFHDEPTARGALSCMMAFRVAPDQIGQCAAALEEKGITLESGPIDQPWKHRTIYFRDPDGNVLEIYADI